MPAPPANGRRGAETVRRARLIPRENYVALDFILRNARITGNNAPVDIAVAKGCIAEIAPRIAQTAPDADAGGHFVSPSLVECHFHLDKARILDRIEPLADRRATDYMKRTASIKHTFTVEDVYKRSAATLDQCILNGAGYMRTHIEVDPNVGLNGFDALERLAKDYAWGFDLQLCVFLQEGWTNVPGAEAIVRKALDRGAKAVGGAPRYDTNGPAQIERIFALGKEYNVDIDIHLDGGYTTHDMDIHQVCDLTDKIGWHGRVAIGHGNKYSCLPEKELAALGKRLAQSGVAVAVLPTTDLFTSGRHLEHSVIRGVADANALIAEGANCAIATNNVLNPFTPYGDCSLVRIAQMYANVVQRGSVKDLTDCFAMITERPARIMNQPNYGIAVGNPADLVVWNAQSASDVIATIASPLMAFKRGHRVMSRELPVLHRPA